jgi:hypothetical protein
MASRERAAAISVRFPTPASWGFMTMNFRRVVSSYAETVSNGGLPVADESTTSEARQASPIRHPHSDLNSSYLRRERVSETKLHSSTRIDEAEWLRPRLRPFLGGVASIVPNGFPAYVRILHPSRGPNNQLSTWAEVASRSGRTMHRLAQFHAIEQPHTSLNGPTRSYAEVINGLVNPPDNGSLQSDLLMALCEILAEHTTARESCFFCLWDGHGWLPDKPIGGGLVFTASADSPKNTASTPIQPSPVLPTFPTEVENQQKIDFPFRSYFLFEGPLDTANQFGWRLTEDCFRPESPNLFWPSDHAWCVASAIDLYCTLVAGSEAMAEALIADKRLETWRVFPEDSVTYGSDMINI